MRILFSSASPHVSSGYANQTRAMLPRLQALGHEVLLHAFYGVTGGRSEMNGIPVLPNHRLPYGQDVIGAHAQRHQVDLVISLIDVWVYGAGFHATLGGIPWAPWTPIDATPAPPMILDRLREAEYPLQFSEFGMAQCQAAGIEAAYLPHGIETTRTYTPGDRAQARAALGLPADAYLVAMVAANQGKESRKAWSQQLEAFATFQRAHPDVGLLLHTQMDPADGVYLPALIEALGIPRQRLWLADAYQELLGYPEAHVVTLYRAADVLLSASKGEGFCLPVAEAQACGCPVVTTNWSALPELTVNGIATEPAGREWTFHRAWWAIPSVPNIVAALETIYGWPTATRQARAQEGRTFIVQRHAWDTVMARGWRPFLARVASERGLDQPAPTDLTAARLRVERALVEAR